MGDDFRDHVDPIQGKRGIDPLDAHGKPPEPRPRSAQSIAGRIIAVHRGAKPAPGQHQIDFTVGGDDFTEIVVRVPPGVYNHLEGKRAVLYIDE